MCSYEDYSAASRSFDRTRVPVGVNVILGCFAQGPKPLGEMTVLDAGCGTGNYSRELLRHVARIEGVDLNEAMIGQATAKLGGDGRVRFQVGSIAEIPLADASVDAITVNQVLHHLPDVESAEDAGSAGFPVHGQAIRELHRVLRPGGVLVINSCTQTQLREGFWYFDLIPKAAEKLRRGYMPLRELESKLVETGFELGGRVVPVNGVLQGKAFFNPLGPLDPDWRDGASAWALATEEELEAALERVRLLDTAGNLEAYVSRLDERRHEIGQTTFIQATRRDE